MRKTDKATSQRSSPPRSRSELVPLVEAHDGHGRFAVRRERLVGNSYLGLPAGRIHACFRRQLVGSRYGHFHTPRVKCVSPEGSAARRRSGRTPRDKNLNCCKGKWGYIMAKVARDMEPKIGGRRGGGPTYGAPCTLTRKDK